LPNPVDRQRGVLFITSTPHAKEYLKLLHALASDLQGLLLITTRCRKSTSCLAHAFEASPTVKASSIDDDR
jgi:hypothetical protein